MPQYRIVKDRYLGFEVQRRRWWLPIWLQVGVNTHTSVLQAEQFIERQSRGGEVKRVGSLLPRFLARKATGDRS